MIACEQDVVYIQGADFTEKKRPRAHDVAGRGIAILNSSSALPRVQL